MANYNSFEGYPNNQWWVAAHSGELGNRPLGRILLERPVVLYRPTPATVAAMEDRCPHRQIPLSLGEVVGDHLQCNYHGLRFGRDGRCVFVPGAGRPAAALDIQSYPVVERDGYIWIWFGTAAPDQALIPDYSWQVSPDYSGRIGYANIECSYLLGIENVLDTSHFAYLHRTSVGSAGYADVPMDSWMEGEEVVSRRRVENLTPSGLFNTLTRSATVTITDEMRWRGPSYLWLTTTVEAPDRTFRVRGLAPYTPGMRHTHHHWFAHFCDFPLTGEQQDAITRAATLAIDEDRVVLAANQQRIDQGIAQEPVMLPGDKAAILMRRQNRVLLARAGRLEAK